MKQIFYSLRVFLSSLAMAATIPWATPTPARGSPHEGKSSSSSIFEPRDPLIIDVIGQGEGDRSYVHKIKNCSPDNHEDWLCRIWNDDWRNPDNHFPVNSQFWSGDTNILFFGERHSTPNHQKQLVHLLPFLKEHGFELLGLEMFNKKDQTYLDEFLIGKLSIDALVEIMKVDWSHDSEGYREILLTAKALQMGLIALDDRKANRFNENQSHDLIVRDKEMAQSLLPYLDKKIVVYTGRLHALKTFFMDGSALAPTIAENILAANPKVKTEHFLFESSKNSGLFPKLLSLSDNEVSVEVFKCPTLNKYLTGFILVPDF